MNATNPSLHPDFGYGNLLTGGMPYDLVPGTQPKFPVSFYYNGDPGPYPIPSTVHIEMGSDHHAILIDTTNCVLYELFNVSPHSTGWQAGSGAIFPLNSNGLRPSGWTSADAAGLPIFPGLIRYDEVASGVINHALRVTVDHTRNQYIWPARHYASYLTGTQYPPMGQRFRLKSTFDISRFPAPVQVILQAAKTYGLILADNGTSWHLSGIGDQRWNDSVMHALTAVSGSNFEAVDESSLMADPNSAIVGAPSGVPTGWVNVISKNSGKCLDVQGGPGATAPTTVMQQWTCGHQQTNQLFKFTPVNGGYQITAQNSGLSLQPASGAASGNGTPVEQWPFENMPYQIWKVSRGSDGFYSITSQDGNSCLDVRAVSQANAAIVQIWSCFGGVNQKWSLTPGS